VSVSADGVPLRVPQGINTGVLIGRVQWWAHVTCALTVLWSYSRKAPAVCPYCERSACCAFWSWCGSCRRSSTSWSSCSKRWTASPHSALFLSCSSSSSGRLNISRCSLSRDAAWIPTVRKFLNRPTSRTSFQIHTHGMKYYFFAVS